MSTPSRLSLTQAPPISVPLRFFFTAPFFGILAALVQINAGPDAVSQWTPTTLAITHLLTLGYISMVMIGAMSQILPVVAGSPLPRPLLVSSVVHTLLTLGVLALASGLLFGRGEAVLIAMFLLGAGLTVFIGAAAYSLILANADNATVSGMRVAIVALAITVVFGLRVAAEHVLHLDLPIAKSWTHAHLTWGFIGWVGILVISVAYEVVPMFQMTPKYPQWMQRWMTKMILVGLLFWTSVYLLAIIDSTIWNILTLLLSFYLAIGLSVFAGVTLYLQSQRQRRIADLTLKFWRLAMVSLLLCTSLWVVGQFWPSLGNWRNIGYLNGMLFIFGFAVSVIIGMLYKIIPFLVWLHLQRQNTRRIKLPNMKEIIPEQRIRWHFVLHLMLLPLLAGVAIKPVWFVYPAATLFGISSLLLLFNIFTALRIYQGYYTSM
ncbi:MAG: hypothetical protein GXP08_07160 [Gammaproteobacteria bacterium]|nr:hypothetical protein [Gammaproteobacteria bacterium]